MNLPKYCALIALCVCSAGCTGTRIGNPNNPDSGPPSGFEAITIEPNKVSAENTGDGVRFTGTPGAAPSDSEVRVAPLDEASMYESAEVEADGSFSFLTNFGSSFYLLQAVTENGISQAVYVPTAYLPSNLECVVPPELQIANDVAPGAELAFELSSQCGMEQPVTLTLHPLSYGVALLSEMSITLPADGSASVVLSVTSDSGEAFEGTVVIRAGDQTLLATAAGTVQ